MTYIPYTSKNRKRGAPGQWHRLPNMPRAKVVFIASRLSRGDCVIVKGKADTFDPNGNWTAAMMSWQPHPLHLLNSFSVWRLTVPPR